MTMTIKTPLLQSSQRMADWLVAYALPVGWLFLLTGMFWIGERPLYHKLYYATLAAPTLLVIVLQPTRLKSLLVQPLVALFLLFSVYILLSVLWANSGETPLGSIKRPLYIVMLMFSAVLISQQDNTRLSKTVEAAAIIAVIAAALSVLYFFYDGAKGRLSGYGALYNPLLSAHVFGFFCAYWLCRWHQHANPATPLALCALVILWVLLVMTGSRTPLAALGACILWLALLQWKNRLWVLLILAGAVVLLLQQLMDATDLLLRGLSYRPAIWAEALRQIEVSPWFGLGYTHPHVFRVEGLEYALNDTHNIGLGVLFAGGIVGFSLWLLMYAYALFYAWKNRRHPGVQIASTLMVFGFAAGLFEGSAFFSRPKEHWFLIWIPLALLAATRISLGRKAAERHETTEKA